MKSYNKKSRNQTYISALCEFINSNYDVSIRDIQPAKRGFYGETWKINTLTQSFFVKIDYSPSHQNTYAQSFQVIEFLNQKGIDFISKIIKTKKGELYTHFGKGILGIFQWIEGFNIDETDDTRVIKYQMLTEIYKIFPQNTPIFVENFAGSSAKQFIEKCENMNTSDPIYIHLKKYSPLLEHKSKRLSYFSEICKKNNSGFVITHGDVNHNLILSNKRYYIVDWDEPLLAPPERDAWLIQSERSLGVINDIFKENNFNYVLDKDRMAYYGSYSFFLYINEFIDKYLYELNVTDAINEIDNFIENWLTIEYQYALE